MERRFRTTSGAVVILDTERLSVDTTDLDHEAAYLAGVIGTVAGLMGKVVTELHTEKAKAKHWYASFIDAALVGNEKLSQWKAEYAAEAREENLKYQTAIAQLLGDIAFLEEHSKGLKAKKDMLQELMQDRRWLYRDGQTVVPREEQRSYREPDRERLSMKDTAPVREGLKGNTTMERIRASIEKHRQAGGQSGV